MLLCSQCCSLTWSHTFMQLYLHAVILSFSHTFMHVHPIPHTAIPSCSHNTYLHILYTVIIISIPLYAHTVIQPYLHAAIPSYTHTVIHPYLHTHIPSYSHTFSFSTSVSIVFLNIIPNRSASASGSPSPPKRSPFDD